MFTQYTCSLTGSGAGKDVEDGILTVTGSRLLYQIVANSIAGVHTLKLIVKSSGLQAYTFTFG